MYDYEWDPTTNGFFLTNHAAKFVASEIRPVFAEELINLNGNEFFDFPIDSKLPILWAKQNVYYYKGEICAKAQIDDQGQYRIFSTIAGKRIKLKPVDIDKMLNKSQRILNALVLDTLRRIKEIYSSYQSKCEVSYIGFSGGKDSLVLLDLCHQVLPLSVPVIFSDTDMEFPDTLSHWEDIKSYYSPREFIKVQADRSAIDYWKAFGPPSQQIRWCCSVMKNTPAINYIHNLTNNPTVKTLSFLGVRADESLRRSTYDDIGDGLKNPNQVNAMPLLPWGAHELYLYIFSKKLRINNAYRLGLPRVGCLMCPMASGRQSALIRKYYSNELQPFNETIKKCISRKFDSDNDLESFISDGGWHTRQSGVNLNEVIITPSETNLPHSLTYDFQGCKKHDLIEWFKTLGSLTYDLDSNEYILSLKECNLRLSFNNDSKEVIVTRLYCTYEDIPKLSQKTLKNIKSVIHKSLGCIGCRTCESECPTGALSFNNKLSVDTNKCIHCLRCHSTQEGCLRYYSKRYAGGLTMNISGINKYLTFGLKTDWLSILALEGENFRSTKALGNRMIPSAITWFREAKLITESKNIQLSHLMDYAQAKGYDNVTLWDCIWASLSNNSPLVKWFVCKTQFNETKTPDELNNELSTNVSSESVRKGALQSLLNMLKSSPLGEGSKALVKLEKKGQRIVALTRIPRSIDKLAVLYSLYVMGAAAKRSSFTISDMMNADFDSAYISPLIAFGMTPDELKGVCLGLSSAYPQFIACSFTLGLDEVKIFPQDKTLDDVVDLALK